LKQGRLPDTREKRSRNSREPFRHQTAHFAGNADALSAAMDENARQHPAKRLDVVRVLDDDDLVADHSRVQRGPDDRGHALVHIFRFEAGKVAELWDVACARTRCSSKRCAEGVEKSWRRRERWA
jgi:predicted SnoaL-like aldol condensation-catalyzing enzyme